MTNAALRGVDKSFPGKRGSATQVLFGVDVTANDGEFVVLLGPSGCGKSTSLRLVAGLEHADRGEIIIGDGVVNDVPASRRELAMVFQSYALFPHMSVEENILYGLKVRRADKAERASRLASVADLLELGPYLERRPAQLSGGQRQRVALGRALVSGASLILMDEPLSNLDARLRQQMRVELRELQRELGLTVIYVTHDQVEAMTMADRVVVMRDGRVDQDAHPRELYARPARAAVARFIGAPPMTLLPASRNGSGLRLDGSGSHVAVDGLAADAPERVLLGVRPEDVVLGSGDHELGARVESVELLGADQLVRLDVGSDTALVARVPGQLLVPDDTRVTAGFARGAVHVFDAETGLRLPRTGEPAVLGAGLEFPSHHEER